MRSRPHTRPPAAKARSFRIAAIIPLMAVLLGIAPAAAQPVPHVLVFSATYGFRHPSIGHGNEVIRELAEETGAFTVEFSELTTDLSRGKLEDVDVLLFNSTTGRFPLTADQRQGLERYWGCGGGFVGIHAAADANYGWGEYAELVGAQFDSHPHGAGSGQARLVVENGDHPVNAAYAGREDWMHADEYYRWMRDVRGTQDVVPLLSLDETTVAAGIQSGSTPYVHRQPLSWVKSFRQRGRVHYNNLGHNEATWDRPEFRRSLVDGIAWTAEISLDPACFASDGELPPGPTAPTPDPEAPREPCVLRPGEQVLTPAGRTDAVANPMAPAYFGKTVRTYVLDLSEHGAPSADVGLRLTWEVPADDYDLAVSTPWGFAGSDAVQPLHEPAEVTRVEDVVHCAPVQVAVFNHAAVSGRAPTLTLAVDGPVEPGPAARLPELPGVPGTSAVVTAPPSATTVGFAPTAAVITQGGSLSLLNADTTAHNLACAERDPVTQRPRCESNYAAVGEQVAVAGVAALPPGDHEFLCQLHPNMVGTLTVVGAPSTHPSAGSSVTSAAR